MRSRLKYNGVVIEILLSNQELAENLNLYAE
jgi:hypothetical protein